MVLDMTKPFLYYLGLHVEHVYPGIETLWLSMYHEHSTPNKIYM